MELQILELKKLPKNIQTGEDIINWMRFFNGKNRKEFENMSKTNIYLGEAYEALQKLGIQLAHKVFKLHGQGKSNAEIAAECNITTEYVKEILG